VANREDLMFESELILSKLRHTDLETAFLQPEERAAFKTGEDKLRLLKARVNQSVFREAVLVNYNNTCAISGIAQRELLIASHIVPWAVDKEARLNPENGLCLSALHDRAFDRGLLGIDADLRVLLSPALRAHTHEDTYHAYFGRYEGQPIAAAGKYAPRRAFLDYHLRTIFRA
jgi:putative restriction endonuclease